jgi:hypothetical protein
MSSEGNRAPSRRLIEEAWNQGSPLLAMPTGSWSKTGKRGIRSAS